MSEYGTVTGTSLCLPFPLRPGFSAQIVIPRHMSHAEARRLCEFVMSLALPEPAIAATDSPQTSEPDEQQKGQP